ncbi:acetyltransferase family protein [Brucella thiophenivorans]|uniref:Acetyltransferase family protein n=2 Tax=Brucella thiophenivorans TaxID=571255 RepID=A0A256FTV4_9HYPH|nr:acetyltransferase family protein [Brucella thiophenivorans]
MKGCDVRERTLISMTYAILPATEELVSEVEIWLDAEEASYNAANTVWIASSYKGSGPERGFRCNWDTVKRNWREGYTPLHVLIKDGLAIGFISGTHIVEIHPDYRGRSIGVLLSDFMLNRARDEGYCVLEIEIAPRTAKPFWLRQGFSIIDEEIHFRNGMHAFITIPRAFPLGSGPKVPVQIFFYDERTFFNKGQPFYTFDGSGERLDDGSIQLPERVIGYAPLLKNNTENRVVIVVDGDEIFSDRSKYGKKFGTQRDPAGNHYIDRILLG